MSMTPKVAGALIGPEAAAIAHALEALGTERFRAINGGFIEDIRRLTQMTDADINPAIERMLELGLVQRRGDALVEIITISKERATVLSGGVL
jgi:DNA-binding MarR family transcriptional regulator